jgi:allantoinase
MPKDFMVPNWSMTEDTFDLLLEAGVRYTTDWMNDDQPYWYELATGKLLDVPYNLETNDFTLALTGRLPGPELARAVIDHFRPALAPRRNARPIHGDRNPFFISGQALRTRYVREYLEHMKAREGVWLTTSDAIYDWIARQSVA